MARLFCPICDKPYTYSRDSASVCGHRGHEVTEASPDEEVPRIAASRKASKAFVCAYAVSLGLILVSPPVAGLCLILTTVVLLFVAPGSGTRCGNCGANLRRAKARHCPTCNASLTFDVR